MTNTTKYNLTTVLMAVGILSVGFLVGFSAYLQPAEAQLGLGEIVSALVGAILNPILGEFDVAEQLQNEINGRTNTILGQQQNPDFGLDAIDNQVEHNTALLEDSDFGLDAIDNDVEYLIAQVDDPDYGLEEIDDEVEHNTALLEDSDFGLDAQTNDPDYGLKRTASDIQHDDWGLEIIDDQIEVMDAKISKQLAKQRVEISLIKSDNDIYLQTSESGKSVDVEFISMQLISNEISVSLTPTEHISPISGTTGLYLLDPDVKGGYDGIYIQVQHSEEPIVHASLPEPIPVDHFGSIMITDTNEKTTSQ